MPLTNATATPDLSGLLQDPGTLRVLTALLSDQGAVSRAVRMAQDAPDDDPALLVEDVAASLEAVKKAVNESGNYPGALAQARQTAALPSREEREQFRMHRDAARLRYARQTGQRPGPDLPTGEAEHQATLDLSRRRQAAGKPFGYDLCHKLLRNGF